MNENDFVVLVDENDNELGVMKKMLAHEKGVLHRAFSVFIFNSKGELLLQQRANHKYHSAGLWTNTCCSHPRPNETIKDAAHRRLFEEMGMVCDLKIIDNFIYKANFDNGLIEHEFDYIIKGFSDAVPAINKDEVESYKWLTIQEIKHDIKLNQSHYTEWFKIALESGKIDY